MQYKLLSLTVLAATVSAQNLTSVLSSNPDLSNVTSYLSLFPTLQTALDKGSNITVLAPSNEAFIAYANSRAGSINDTAAVEALLTYHVLNGTYKSDQFISTAEFFPTLLTDPKYANVTGGQRVEAIIEGQNVTFYSGLLQNSTLVRTVSFLMYLFFSLFPF